MSTCSVYGPRGRKISTTVAKKNKDVDDGITSFLFNRNNFVIGLDTELTLSRDSEGVTRSKLAILTLCDEYNCLIVQLPHLDSVPTSLCNFLQLADYTFVGFNIARSVERLEKEYGFGCKNYEDLKTMATKDDVNQQVTLTTNYDGFSFDQPDFWAIFCDWGQNNLNEYQVTLTTLNCNRNRDVGKRLGVL